MTALRDIVLATKGVRRVRTPAGVAYFGLPIGSIITRDVRERAKARRRKKTRTNHPKKRPQRRDGQSGRGKGPVRDGSLGKIARDSDAVNRQQFKKRAAGSYLLNGKQHRITKADTDYNDVNIVKDKRTGSIFVMHGGKPTVRIDKSGRKSTAASTVGREFDKARNNVDLAEYDDDNDAYKPPTQATRKPNKNVPSPYDEAQKYGVGSKEHVRAALALAAGDPDSAPKLDLHSASDGLGMEIVKRRKTHGINSSEYNEVYDARQKILKALHNFDRPKEKSEIHKQAESRLAEGDGARGVRKWNSADARKQYEGNSSVVRGEKIYFTNKNGEVQAITKIAEPFLGQGSHWKSDDGTVIGRPGDLMIGDYIRDNSKDGNVYFPRLEYVGNESRPTLPEVAKQKPAAKPNAVRGDLTNDDLVAMAKEYRKDKQARAMVDNEIEARAGIKVGERVRFQSGKLNMTSEGTVTAIIPFMWTGDDGKEYGGLEVMIRRDGSSRGVRLPDKNVEKIENAPTLAEVAKPTPKSRASRTKTPAKIEPSKDTKDYIDEMRGYHDRGFAGWDEAMGQEREVGKMADRYADRYDKNVARIEELYLLKEENDIAYEEGDRSEPGLGQWQQQELDMLLRNNEGLLRDVNTLNDLADLDRDLTVDDIPDDFGDSISMFLTVKARAGNERIMWKRDVADYLNTKRVASQNKDSSGRTVPPQALMDARDDYADLGKQLMKEINAHMDNDPGVLAARKNYDDIDNGDPRPVLDMTGFEKMSFEQRRALSDKYTKELDAWYKRRGFADSAYSTVRDFDNERAAKLRQADKELAIAERKVKLEYLNSIRPMGAHPEAMPRFIEGRLDTRLGRARQVRGKAEQAQWDAMAEEALSVYPSSWVAAIPDKYFIRAWSDRAFYNGPPTGTDGETLPDIHTNNGTHVVAFRPPNQAGVPEDYRNTSFSDYSVESAAHEFGHAMETFIPGITALEWAENYHRSGRSRDNGDWENIKTQAGMMGGETGFEDNWKNNYPGRAYATESDWNGDIHKEHWEVFTTGVQDTFGRSSRTKKYTHAGDDSVEQIILALMVTSNYYEDEEDFRK